MLTNQLQIIYNHSRQYKTIKNLVPTLSILFKLSQVGPNDKRPKEHDEQAKVSY